MGFQYLLSGVTAGHGAMAVQAVNVPVSVAGMDVAPSELIHYGRERRGEVSCQLSWRPYYTTYVRFRSKRPRA